MIGIEDLEEAVVMAAKFANPLLDGLQPKDFIPIATSLMDLPKVIDGFEEIPDQIDDLDPLETQKLENAAIKHLTNATSEQAKELLPVLIRFGLVTFQLIGKIAAIRNDS